MRRDILVESGEVPIDAGVGMAAEQPEVAKIFTDAAASVDNDPVLGYVTDALIATTRALD